MNNVLLKGKGWVVAQTVHGPRVYAARNLFHMEACRVCAAQAHEGNPSALSAVLMCPDDGILQDCVRKLK